MIFKNQTKILDNKSFNTIEMNNRIIISLLYSFLFGNIIIAKHEKVVDNITKNIFTFLTNKKSTIIFIINKAIVFFNNIFIISL